jgi:hypothetical protein
MNPEEALRAAPLEKPALLVAGVMDAGNEWHGTSTADLSFVP